ncbi:unnamed protein product [Brassica napus]|uniref:(rape) hypothetical protein n=1 Tax=Brassica napus TaxID=3708 RepID=A0A816JV14_BRANA|nr:unnamed protein product [Brassica napus]
MALIVMVSRLSSLRPSSPPLRPRPPPDPPPSLPSPVPFEALSPQPCSSSLAQALTPHEPPDLPPCLFSPVPFEALSRTEPRILPALHSASLFTCTLTHHSPSLKRIFRIWKLDFQIWPVVVLFLLCSLVPQDLVLKVYIQILWFVLMESSLFLTIHTISSSSYPYLNSKASI